MVWGHNFKTFIFFGFLDFFLIFVVHEYTLEFNNLTYNLYL